jgi:hypothetical protein
MGCLYNVNTQHPNNTHPACTMLKPGFIHHKKKLEVKSTIDNKINRS